MTGNFSHCAVCRRNHEQGKRHRYSASHKKALEQALSKAHEKMAIIRAALDQPQAAAQSGHSFWCWFCEEDVVDHHNSSLFAWSSAIYHLASSKHGANWRKFCFEHGADTKRRQEFCFSDKELRKWEEMCNSSPPSSLENRDQDNIHNAGNSSFAMLSSVSVEPLLDLKVQKSVEGNVHTGAVPPWLADMKSSNVECSAKVTSKRKEREAKRLDKRVGAAWANKRRAEMELEKLRGQSPKHSSSSTSNWLPSFGGVWQNGTRSESRKEFEAENVTAAAPARAPPATVEPYVGKRKRMATSSGEHSAVEESKP